VILPAVVLPSDESLNIELWSKKNSALFAG